jgi:hypothetical protein
MSFELYLVGIDSAETITPLVRINWGITVYSDRTVIRNPVIIGDGRSRIVYPANVETTGAKPSFEK